MVIFDTCNFGRGIMSKISARFHVQNTLKFKSGNCSIIKLLLYRTTYSSKQYKYSTNYVMRKGTV